ncbi:MAG: HRDC domain-containing protein [Deltaproteobacteria bacterium]|nr:HRDC domain-containing protein [Deltaproteobacteria bacterium]MBK8720263.1 HRDC domain-containing protein [Deltaproteobacteria bacterium]MBP7287633.1 HRDC domain-containing protein [Nannocystaceae bacterium]
MAEASALLWVDDADALAHLAEQVRGAEVGALDTEGNGMYAWRERVCLLQLSIPGLDAIVDVLAVDPAPLASWLADPACVKIMHAADNDVVALRRDFGLTVTNLFDTLLAVRLLGRPQRGLADLLTSELGVETDKRWQRFDWSKRPLPAEAIAYARTDTRHLASLRERLMPHIVDSGHLELFEHACERITRLQARARSFDEHSWARIGGARELDDEARSVLAAMVVLREALARENDRAPYRIIGDAGLLAIAVARPSSRAELSRIAGVGGPLAHRYAERVLQTIAHARTAPPPPWPGRAPRAPAAFLRRLDALRTWRRDHAAALGVEADIVLSKDALTGIAEAAPGDLDALRACDALDDWELARFGPALLECLARPR